MFGLNVSCNNVIKISSVVIGVNKAMCVCSTNNSTNGSVEISYTLGLRSTVVGELSTKAAAQNTKGEEFFSPAQEAKP